MLLFFMLGRFVNGIKRFSENEKPVVQVFQHQIAHHIQNRDKYIVPSAALRQKVSQNSGERREYRVKERDLQHGNRHVSGGTECEPSV